MSRPLLFKLRYDSPFFFVFAGYNPVTENARLVQLLATYFEDNLGFVDLVSV